MADAVALLGALVATGNLSHVDADGIEAFLDMLDELGIESPDLTSAMDLVLNFFCDTPDAEAAKVAERAEATHDATVCPDCGGPTMDEVDIEQAIDVWGAIRGVVDKYMFDREIDQEEC